MTTIKKNSIVIEINNIGKMFEIKRITTTRTITTYSRRKDIDKKVDLLIQPLKEIRKTINIGD